MKLLIAGDDTFDDVNLFKEKCDALLVNSTDIEIISGRTTTMDTLTEIYALAEDYPVRVLDYGYQMTEADALIVFWDGKNEKTARTISLAEEHGHKVRIVKY